MSTLSTPSSKPARRTPFTPSKRPLSSSSSSSSSSDLVNRLNRTGSSSSGTSNILGSTHKRYKAPVSSESRPRTYTKPLSTIPGSPRPKTPYERSKTPTFEDSPTSKMDVSNVDPEAVLVDSETVEADVSAEMDEAWLRTMSADHGKRDKVMVSIRRVFFFWHLYSAWIASSSASSIHLDPVHAKSGAPNPAENKFDFDSVLTGSPNKPIYSTVAQSHVYAAMEGYNSVIFAYGQTASGKTYTLSGDESEPGIIPRAMKDVFRFIKRNEEREYLLRCSYLEIYNESIHDLLAPVGSPAVMIQGGGSEVILNPLREEVVTSLKGVKDVLKRGESHRRTACTDWNERSSRSHSVFRLVIESRERGEALDESFHGRVTPAPSGRQTPGVSGRQTPGHGAGGKPGPKLQARGGRSVQTSVLSLIDLAGSEKATSDKERTREGKYINTSLLTLGTVIGTLSENVAKGKSDHVPFRNSKLTRMLQPSLSGNARISVVCTINPDISAIAESTSTLLFARRIKGVKLNAQKKEIVDTDALIERYRKEIEDLKARLAEKEAAVGDRRQSSSVSVKRRLSVKEKTDESKAMKDLNTRIQQLTKLILTSQTVDESSADSRPGSPVKIDFDMSPYQLQQELLAARLQLESQATQILSLEAALEARPPIPPENERDKMIADQAKVIKELEIVVRGYESNLGEPLRAVREDVEREWMGKVGDEVRKREEKERWADELVKQLEKEKHMRIKVEDQARALTAFVTKLDALGLGGLSLGSINKENESLGSPGKGEKYVSLLDQVPEEEWSMTGDFSFEMEKVPAMKREPFGGKENVAL
ncbi:kinesin-domain-containing protein [Guyanagaster necrorhizus]|uniref:Kinesin-like protein n=1 Tax=Guyanagaster necrorhizus TaxID=856835 RepID=A0A9P8AS37_9AGAR|nr:kinesin-domain-containing protein [Guyanagaster necrorhizus MCA 3950]KAG7445566.1 kinesin-domain-containing protein [Guyanagaster necrorhizus MCA 3950]